MMWFDEGSGGEVVNRVVGLVRIWVEAERSFGWKGERSWSGGRRAMHGRTGWGREIVIVQCPECWGEDVRRR